MKQRLYEILKDARRADCLTGNEAHAIAAAVEFAHNRTHDVVYDKEEFTRRFGELGMRELDQLMKRII